MIETDNKKLNKKLGKLRVWNNKGDKKNSPKQTIKCGCCDESLEIFYDFNSEYGILEINGVAAPKSEWREILLPLLGVSYFRDLIADARGK